MPTFPSRRQFLLQTTGLLLASACKHTDTPAKTTYRFAVASDAHYGEPYTDYQTFLTDLSKALTAEKTTNGLDFLVFNGDLGYKTRPDLMPEAKRYLDTLGLPYWVTRGNHDALSNADWKNTFGYDPNHVEAWGPDSLVLMDTSDGAGGVLCPDTGWLGTALGGLKDRRNVFVFMHVPFIRSTSPESAANCTGVEPLLAATPGLRALFHGHDHNQDAGYQVGRVGLFFDGHVGSSWGVNYRGYRIVEVGENSVLTYQMDVNGARRVNQTTL